MRREPANPLPVLDRLSTRGALVLWFYFIVVQTLTVRSTLLPVSVHSPPCLTMGSLSVLSARQTRTSLLQEAKPNHFSINMDMDTDSKG